MTFQSMLSVVHSQNVEFLLEGTNVSMFVAESALIVFACQFVLLCVESTRNWLLGRASDCVASVSAFDTRELVIDCCADLRDFIMTLVKFGFLKF